MGNCKKICFIFLSLFLFTQPSFAERTAAVLIPGAAKQSYRQAVGFLSMTPMQANYQASQPDHFFLVEDATAEDVLSKKVYKIKKRYKRVLPASTTLRPPVRDVDIVPQNIYIKETYSKPYFLSPLHRFLFRLTPF